MCVRVCVRGVVCVYVSVVASVNLSHRFSRVWVVVGSGGGILHSTDGRSFRHIVVGTTFYSVALTQNLVAMFGSSKYAVSDPAIVNTAAVVASTYPPLVGCVNQFVTEYSSTTDRFLATAANTANVTCGVSVG